MHGMSARTADIASLRGDVGFWSVDPFAAWVSFHAWDLSASPVEFVTGGGRMGRYRCIQR